MSQESQEIMPSLFIGHGTPMLAFADDAYTRALKKFSESFPSPKAIVVVSAHGLSSDGVVEVSTGRECRLNYDFTGFPSDLYQMEYPCPGSPEVSGQVAGLLADSGFQVALNPQARLDHGVWIPLKVAYPEAKIPVIQVSMPFPAQPQLVLKLGKSLSSLREKGILLVGSGGVVHNLRKLVWHGKNEPPAPWATEFEQWVKKQLALKNVELLTQFEVLGPHAELAAPTHEHFYPLFFTVGAALPGDQFTPIFEGVQYSSLSMMSFVLNRRVLEPFLMKEH